MNGSRVHFISYADKVFDMQLSRICTQAKESNFFNSVTALKPSFLGASFFDRFEDILTQERGAGYWIWKPYLIKKALRVINDNDFLVYLDAGCTINADAEKRFIEYIDMLASSEFSAISFKFLDSWRPERNWTFAETFNYFNLDLSSSAANTGQIVATAIVLQKTEHSVFLIDQWMKVLHENKFLFTDEYQSSPANIAQSLIENRHDQSIFSIIRKIHGSIILSDETRFLNGHKDMLKDKNVAKKYPFWATKIR